MEQNCSSIEDGVCILRPLPGENMNLKQVLAQLIAQRSRLDDAIVALQKLSNENATASTATLATLNGRRHRRRMSPEAKKRISEMMKKRWAERKRAAKSA